ncbi:MAG: hypothetical protein ACXV3B_08015 [Ilumatobacteraceae bacterium]
MRARHPSARSIAVAVVVAALAAPCLWAVLAHRVYAVGDIALIELRTRDVLTAHPPLVGAYSRYGWSHPGPAEFYLFAIPYRLFGGDARALRLTALLFNIATLSAIAWVVRQRGVTALVVTLAGASGLVWGLTPNALADSWNVTIAVLPFLLTVVACWCAWCGDRWAWMAAAIAFSFVFQAHIGFGVVLVPLMGITGAGLFVQGRRGRIDISPRSIGLGIAAAGALALPALYDVVAHWPGNIWRLITWSFDNKEQTIGFSESVRLLGRSSSLSFPLHPRFPNQFVFSIDVVDSGFLPGALILLLVVALVVTVRRGMLSEAWLCTCLTVLWISGLIAAARVTRPLAFWLVEWLQPLAWLTWGAIALVAWRLLQTRAAERFSRVRIRQAGAVAGLVALVVGTVGYTHGTASANAHDTTIAPIKAFVSATAQLDKSQPVHISYGGDPFAAGTIFLAVADEMDRAGFRLCVDAAYANQFGGRRVCEGRSDFELFIRDEPTALAPPDNSTTLAISDPLSGAQRAEADSLTASLTDTLVRNDLADDEPLLYTPLAAVVLRDLPPSEATSNSGAVHRLSELRTVPGTRLGFYQVARSPRT